MKILRRGLLLATAVALAATAFTTTASSSTAPPRAAVVTHPNVILFLLDDADVEDVGAQYMPQVQARLVQQGVTFARNYAPYPLCCPSRTTLFTGKYSHNTHVTDNIPPLGGAQAFNDSQTIATWLNADYRTGLVGKYLNQYGQPDAGGLNYVPPGWNTWNAALSSDVFKYLNQRLNIDGTIQSFPGRYSTTLYGDQAINFLSSSSQEPFFLETAFFAPHGGEPHEAGDPVPQTPYVDTPYQNTYTGPPQATDPSVNEPNISDKRFSFQDTPLITPAKMADISEQIAQRRESLHSVDDQIARIMDKVTAIGQAANTYYIFTSDNGFFNGQHRIPGEKRKAYEADAKVPLVIVGPGLPAGTTVTQLSGMQDIAPTILKMTGESSGVSYDGMQLIQFALGGTSTRAELLETTPVDPNAVAENYETGVVGAIATLT